MQASKAQTIQTGSTIFIQSFDKHLIEKVVVTSYDKKTNQFLVSSKGATSDFRVSVGEAWDTEKESLVALSSGFGGDIDVLEKEIACLNEQIKRLKSMDSALKRRLKTLDALESIRK